VATRIKYWEPDLDESSLDLSPLMNRRSPLDQCTMFEKEFAKFIGTEYAVAVGSGSAAIHLSLVACNVGPGDEVVTVPNTCTAVSDAILWAGATPVFIDIQEKDFNMDPDRLEEAITKRTKAILPVHMYGQPADLDPICEVGEKHGLIVIEDVAQSAGALYKGKRAGSAGTTGCFSFSGKNLSVLGLGGMITTNVAKIDETLRMLRHFGRRDGSSYQEVLGYRYGMSELHAMIGRRQLSKLDERNLKRREIAGMYSRTLQNSNEVVLPVEMDYARHVYCHYVVRAKRRDDLRSYLLQSGIETSCHYPIPIHTQKVYASRFGFEEGAYPITEKVAREVVSLPTRPNLRECQVETIARRILEFYASHNQ